MSNKSVHIVEVDVDEATYIGSEEDGVYYQIGPGPDGWYMSAIVDCNTSGFVEGLVNDQGPYVTKGEAQDAGRDAAMEWCIENEVQWSTLNRFSYLMFEIKYQRPSMYDVLLEQEELAKFMTMEESALTPLLERELEKKINLLQMLVELLGNLPK